MFRASSNKLQTNEVTKANRLQQLYNNMDISELNSTFNTSHSVKSCHSIPPQTT